MVQVDPVQAQTQVKEEPPEVEVYQLHILLLGISPAIQRRLVLRSDSSIADLHYFIQITFSWTDSHLHQFKHHGKTYGVYHLGGLDFDTDPKKVRLRDLKLRLKERFEYQYNLTDNWRHQVRLEKILPLKAKKTYPVCIGGSGVAPPEACGSPAGFLEAVVKLRSARWEKEGRLAEIMAAMLPHLENGWVRDFIEPYRALLAELKAAKFDREAVNRRLLQYVKDDPAWLEGFSF